MKIENPQTLRCYHCGNETPHELVQVNEGKMLYEQIDDKRYNEPYVFIQLICGTCRCLNVIGGFKHELKHNGKFNRLYPTGSEIQPPPHQWGGAIPPVPLKLVKLYDEVYFLRIQAPNAFANQIRRCLEFICNDQKAKGDTLFKKLDFLVEAGVFPGHYKEITEYIRKVGNIGSHSLSEDIDVWDAELLDEFFRIVVEYVYVAPAKIKRLRQRLTVNK